MARADDTLPGLGRKTLSPRLRGDAPLAKLKLSQSEGYVLSRIDGRTTLWEVCLLSPLQRDETLRILRRMRAAGVIEIPGSTEPVPELEPEPSPSRPPGRPAVSAREPGPTPPRPPTPSTPPPPPVIIDEPTGPITLSTASVASARLELEQFAEPLRADPADTDPMIGVEVLVNSGHSPGMVDDTRPTSRSRPSVGSHGSGGGRGSAPSVPSAIDEEVSGAAAIRPGQRSMGPPLQAGEPRDLTPDQVRRIDEVYNQINLVDAFTLLGVTPDDDKRALQRAYFKLSKEFHPDRFFKKDIGSYRQLVAAIFQAITEARDTLIDDERRAAYLLGEGG